MKRLRIKLVSNKPHNLDLKQHLEIFSKILWKNLPFNEIIDSGKYTSLTDDDYVEIYKYMIFISRGISKQFECLFKECIQHKWDLKIYNHRYNLSNLLKGQERIACIIMEIYRTQFRIDDIMERRGGKRRRRLNTKEDVKIIQIFDDIKVDNDDIWFI